MQVTWVDLSDLERDHLADLGVREGALVHVVQCGAFGGRVIAVGSDRIAIDGATSACIGVTPATAGSEKGDEETACHVPVVVPGGPVDLPTPRVR